MSRQTLSAAQFCGVAIALASYLTDRTFQGGPPLFHSVLQAGLPLGIILACYGTTMLTPALLLAGSYGAVIVFRLRGWPVAVLLLACLVAVIVARVKEFRAWRKRGAA